MNVANIANREGIVQDDTDVINADSYHICTECNGEERVEMDSEKLMI